MSNDPLNPLEKEISYSEVRDGAKRLYFVRFYINHTTLEDAHLHGYKVIDIFTQYPKLRAENEELRKSKIKLQEQFDEADSIIERLGKNGLELQREINQLKKLRDRFVKYESELNYRMVCLFEKYGWDGKNVINTIHSEIKQILESDFCPDCASEGKSKCECVTS